MSLESFSRSPNKIEREKAPENPEKILERVRERFYGLSRALFLAGVLLFPSKEILAKEKPESLKETQKIQKVEKQEKVKSRQEYFDEMWKKYIGEEPLPQISDAKMAEELERGLKELEEKNKENMKKVLDTLTKQPTKKEMEVIGKKYLPNYEYKPPKELLKEMLDLLIVPELPSVYVEKETEKAKKEKEEAIENGGNEKK